MIVFILAGGSGSRLWPMSRSMTPKQFLNLGSTHESLFQETYSRLAPLMEKDKTFIIGSKDHQLELQYQLEELDPEFSPDCMLLEPQGRNTAPAILWGLSQLSADDLDTPVVILPADHKIHPQDKFLNYLEQAASLSKEGWIVTFGVEPTRPDTGYGYIKRGEALAIGAKVEAFKEKPDLKTAEEFLQEGGYAWNAGIFMGTARTLLAEFEQHTPEMYDAFFHKEGKVHHQLDIVEAYNKIQADSIDYAILEKSKKVATITIDLDWNDLGSWESIYQISPKDQNQNATQGNVILQDSENCLVISQKNLIAGVGLKDLILIETDDAMLVCDMKRAQDIKMLVGTLQKTNRTEHQFHTTVLRPWGSYRILFEREDVKVKTIEVKPGKRLSLQRHFHRSEHWVVSQGTAVVTKGEEEVTLLENESIYIPKTVLHRIYNPGKLPLEIIEVQMGDYLGEDDIQRVEDDFTRE